jgi:hypothetical protein
VVQSTAALPADVSGHSGADADLAADTERHRDVHEGGNRHSDRYTRPGRADVDADTNADANTDLAPDRHANRNADVAGGDRLHRRRSD